MKAARLRRALEEVARVYASFAAHEITAEAAAYRVGEIALGEINRVAAHGTWRR